MTEYPDAIKSFATLQDAVDSVLAAHQNERGDEITAIETELGMNPADKTGGAAGTYATVKARLDKAHRGATLLVAASDASLDSRQFADYVCDGIADEVQINAAIAALPTAGGRVQLSEGTFTLAAPIYINSDAVSLVGVGAGAPSGGIETGHGTLLDVAAGFTPTSEAVIVCLDNSNNGTINLALNDVTGINATDTNIAYDGAGSDPNVGDILWMENEQMEVVATTGGGTPLTVVRGVNGSTAAAHVDDTEIKGSRGVYGAILRDFIIDGNSVAGGIDGIWFYSHRGKIENVHIWYMTGDGVRFSRGSSWWSFYDTHIAACQVYHVTGSGVITKELAGDLKMYDCVLAYCGTGYTSNGSGCFISMNHIYCNTNNLIENGGTNTKYIGNKFDNSTGHSVIVTAGATHMIIDANSFTDTDGNLDADDTYSGLIFTAADGNPYNCVVSNNVFYGKVGTNDWKYGLNISHFNCRGFQCTGNTFDAEWSANGQAVNNAGIGCVVESSTVKEGSITDPGDGNAISRDMSGYVPLVTTSAETRTLAGPRFMGQEITLYMKTDGGDCVVTIPSIFNETGNNTITFANTGEFVTLRAIEEGASKVWRVIASDGATLSTV